MTLAILKKKHRNLEKESLFYKRVPQVYFWNRLKFSYESKSERSSQNGSFFVRSKLFLTEFIIIVRSIKKWLSKKSHAKLISGIDFRVNVLAEGTHEVPYSSDPELPHHNTRSKGWKKHSQGLESHSCWSDMGWFILFIFCLPCGDQSFVNEKSQSDSETPTAI